MLTTQTPTPVEGENQVVTHLVLHDGGEELPLKLDDVGHAEDGPDLLPVRLHLVRPKPSRHLHRKRRDAFDDVEPNLLALAELRDVELARRAPQPRRLHGLRLLLLKLLVSVHVHLAVGGLEAEDDEGVVVEVLNGLALIDVGGRNGHPTWQQLASTAVLGSDQLRHPEGVGRRP